MPKNKRKNKAGAPTPESDPREEKEGKYLSRLAPETLAALQKRKTVLMLISTLLFAVSLFLPVEGRKKVADVLWLNTLYVFYWIALILVSVLVSYLGFKKHKLRSEIWESEAPKNGFDRHTYWSYEIFNAMHVVMFVADVVVGCLILGVWGFVNMAVIGASAVLSFLSRQALYLANANNLDFLPARGQGAGEITVEEASGEADEFYEPGADRADAESATATDREDGRGEPGKPDPASASDDGGENPNGL